MSTLEFCPLDQIPDLVTSTRQAFDAGLTRSLEWRLAQLDGILRFVKEKQSEILDALRSDLGKPKFDALTAEIVSVEWEAQRAKKHLKSWMRPERVRTPALHQPGTSMIYKDPLGVVLVMGAWNYPIQLTLGPLVGALAAGNAAVLKPSEVSPVTSELLARYLPEYLDSTCLKVIQGGVPESTELLKQRFDHILYTGNGSVGRIVMRAAAEHLTPVTLELGGKSPCIVDGNTDLEVTASRIVWGKFFNCGQTCVAPDYVLVSEAVYGELVPRLKQKIQEFWGAEPQGHAEYGRIINQRHHQRLMGLLNSGGEVVCGGHGDEADRYIAPTLLTEVPLDSALMQDEIFGPLLPVVSVPDVEAAIDFINARPKPLALYIFSDDEQTQKAVLERTSSGGAMVNHCLLHNLAPDLPFGGVGASGMGAYHGKAGFDTFTHRKSVLKKPFALDMRLMYPTYSGRIAGLVERLIRWWRALR